MKPEGIRGAAQPDVLERTRMPYEFLINLLCKANRVLSDELDLAAQRSRAAGRRRGKAVLDAAGDFERRFKEQKAAGK